MRTIWKMALGALSLGALAACQPYDGYDGGYYAGGVGYGYCDSFGCPDNYWDQPLYYGSVYYGGTWRNGPFYYRDFNGGRQYWLGGGWRNDGWRGDRPQQYRDGRYGPALGREWYRNNQNRPGFNRDRDRDGRPGFNRDDRGPRGGNRGEGNRGDGNRGERNLGRNQAEIQQQRAQPPQSPPPDRFGRDRAPPPSGEGPRRGGRFGGDR